MYRCTAVPQCGSLAVLVSLLFGGFLLSRNKMPGLVGLAAGGSYVRWGFEALASNEFHGADGFRFTAFHQVRVLLFLPDLYCLYCRSAVKCCCRAGVDVVLQACCSSVH